MPPAWERTRVIKKISATQPGALKLARRHGDALVCVRYRHSQDGSTRYTTVELVVDEAKVVRRRPRQRDHDIVMICLRPGERELRHLIQSAGGRWDEQRLVWRLRRGKAQQLGLLERAIE